MSRSDKIFEGVLTRDPWALGKLARMIDDDHPGKEDLLARLHSMGGSSRIVGITGPPGVGKSTLINAVIRQSRQKGLSVGVLAVDPTSPYTGGAVLGDRVRMQEHGTDPGVYIRSLATRGHMGGLTRSVQDLVALLDAAGFDLIILETVGVGQEEVEIKDLAQTVVFVTVPGLGDGVQTMKAGVLEIAHVYLVNKADKNMVDETVKDLEVMLSMSEDGPAWVPPVLTSVATEPTGVDRLMEEIDRHYAYLESSGDLDKWRRSVASVTVKMMIKDLILQSLEDLYDSKETEFEADVGRVGSREEDPGSVARRWLRRLDFSED